MTLPTEIFYEPIWALWLQTFAVRVMLSAHEYKNNIHANTEECGRKLGEVCLTADVHELKWAPEG